MTATYMHLMIKFRLTFHRFMALLLHYIYIYPNIYIHPQREVILGIFYFSNTPRGGTHVFQSNLNLNVQLSSLGPTGTDHRIECHHLRFQPWFWHVPGPSMRRFLTIGKNKKTWDFLRLALGGDCWLLIFADCYFLLVVDCCCFLLLIVAVAAVVAVPILKMKNHYHIIHI